MRAQIEDPHEHLTKLEAMRMLREKDTALTAALREKDTAVREKDTVLREKDVALREKDTVLREKDAAAREKDTEIGDLHTQVQVSYPRYYELK